MSRGLAWFKEKGRRHLTGPVFSLGSQATGLVQLLLLLARAGANEYTDAYFYLFNVGMLPIQIILVGTVYPLLLNAERITRRGLRVAQFATTTTCAVLTSGGAFYLFAQGRLPTDASVLAGLLVANAVIQSLLWFRAIAAEAGGSSTLISGIALPANLLAVAALALPWPSAASSTLAMSVGLSIGNALLYVVIRRRQVGSDVLAAAPSERHAFSAAPFWFAGKGAVNYVGLIILQSLAVLLPPSSVTALNVAMKIPSSLSSSLVNAVMPRLVHRETATKLAAQGFIHRLTLFLIPVSTLIAVTAYLSGLSSMLAAICIALWSISSTNAAAAQRIAFRFLPANASRLPIIIVPITVSLSWLSSSNTNYTLVTLLCAYASIDAAVAASLSHGIKDSRTTVVNLIILLALASVWIASLSVGGPK